MEKLPMLLKPAFKDYLWGGTRLRSEFGKQCSLDKIAESWELSCHPDGESVICSGEYSGMTLSEYLRRTPDALGTAHACIERLPVLVKLIDARDRLSVQVHPDDAFAMKHENKSGKTEMWYILDCDENAEIICGFQHEITHSELLRRINANTLEAMLKRVRVKKDDVFFITAGTVHAIGKGILLAEIQQSSDITYRLYDYDRRDENGVPRRLHIQKAAMVATLSPTPQLKRYPEENGSRLLADCKHFTVSLTRCAKSGKIPADERSFAHLLITDGEGELSCESARLPLFKGQSVFIPASSRSADITGRCEYITTTLHKPLFGGRKA